MRKKEERKKNSIQDIENNIKHLWLIIIIMMIINLRNTEINRSIDWSIYPITWTSQNRTNNVCEYYYIYIIIMKIKCLFTFYHHHTLSSILNQEKEFNYSPYIYIHKHKPNTHTHKRSMRMEKNFFFNRKKMNKIVICCCKPHHHQYKAQERIQDQRPTTTAEKNIYTMSILHRIYILKWMYVCGILLLYMR